MTKRNSIITELRPLPSMPTVCSIRVDGRVVARLRENDVTSLGLEVGRIWDRATQDAVQHAIDLQKARAEAFRQLARRGLTRKELSERLIRRNLSRIIVEQLLDEFTADGWLDDASYARDLAESALRKKPLAQSALFHQLTRRGIDESVARIVSDEALAQKDMSEEALRLAHDKLRSIRARDVRTRVRRVAGTLSRHGYDDELINTVLFKLGLDPAEYSPNESE